MEEDLFQETPELSEIISKIFEEANHLPCTYQKTNNDEKYDLAYGPDGFTIVKVAKEYSPKNRY